MSELPGQVGPYSIDSRLGAGGMGTVYKAWDPEREAYVALKVLPPTLAKESGFLKRFAREIDVLRGLRNPHIVELLGSGVDGDTHFYAMEFVDGETLALKLAKSQRLPWQDVVEMATQVCVALKAAHDQGVIHRDLKPSNLLVTDDNTVKLTDFGIAHVFASSRLTSTGGVIGTAEYMSPEQAQGKRVTKKSDLYSLGAVIYAMLTGRPPFVGRTVVDVLHKHQYSQFDRPDRFVTDLPRSLNELVCELLEKAPDDRPPDAYVVSRRLQSVQETPGRIITSHTEMLGSEEIDGAAATIAVDPADKGSSTEESPTSPGSLIERRGVGTIVRDLIRAEIEEENRPSALGRFFDNIWVLLVLLVLLVSGGFYLVGDPDPPAEEIEAASNEPQRLLRHARSLERLGDIGEARRRLLALRELVSDAPGLVDVREEIDRRLQRIAQTEESSNGSKFRQEAMGRAQDRLESGRVDEARAIWQAVIDVYSETPAAATDVRKAEEMLNSHASP